MAGSGSRRRTVVVSHTTRTLTLSLLVAGSCLAPGVGAQEIFHSTQAANLTTTSGIRGRVLFEISHRFLPPVSNGSSALWGLDGPVYNRIGLTVFPAPNTAFALQRSNFDDNVELNGRVRIVEAAVGPVPVEAAVMGGIAWNMDPALLEGAEDNESQLYAQVIVNALVGERIAVGLVPTLLRNPRIRDIDVLTSFTLGVHGQVYLTDAMSVLGEWIFSEEVVGLEHDSGTFGVEFETRGHFFKLLVTNQPRMNPTQFLAGSPNSFQADDLRLGFNVTRVLPF